MSTHWIRILALSSLAAFCLLCPNPTVPSADATPPGGYVLVWSDEFNGTTLDTNKWGHPHPGEPRGGRIAIQKVEAVSVSGGKLVIRTYSDAVDPNDPDPPPQQHYTGMIQSGVATTLGECQMPPNELVPTGNKYLPRYGYIEASIDFDGASGMWHSFFVQTPNNLLAGPLDEHLRGMEMDIVEHKKMEGSTNVETQAPTAIHWKTGTSPSICYPNTPISMSEGGGPHSGNGSLATGFHAYGLEWTPDYLKFYYDNILVWRVNDSDPCPPGPPCVVAPVSHVPEIIMLCGEVPTPSQNSVDSYGSIPFPFGFSPLGSANNPKMTVEYVRHYQLLVPPSSLTATPAVSPTQINLEWTDNTHAEEGFKIERSTDCVNFSQVGTVDDNVLTYEDTGLSPNTRYFYRVRAYIGALHSPYSFPTDAVTDASPPAAVTNLSVPSVEKKNVAVSWSAPGDDGTGQRVTAYDLRYSSSPITASNFLSATQVTTGTPNIAGSTECRNIGWTTCGTKYFAIKSKDEAGNWSAISNVPGATPLCGGPYTLAECPEPEEDAIPPADVTDLSVPSVGQTTMAVSWTAPGDDGDTGTAIEYDLRYSAGPIDAASFGSATRVITLAPAPAESPECHLFTCLSPGTGYYFALKTRDEWGNWSGISNVANAATVTENWFAECGGGNPVAKLPVMNDEAPRLFSAPRPNPAHGTTSFRISVPSQSQLRVGVYDVAGRRVRSLVDRTASPGPAQIEWNLLNDSGHRVASGLYMVRVDVGDKRETFRLVVVR